jgi:rubrerythrin
VAARLAEESGRFKSDIFNLEDGMGGWTGFSLPDLPPLDAFDPEVSFKGLLIKAMDMEKGAEQLYRRIGEASQNQQLCELMGKLAPMERSHAKSVYRHLQEVWDEDVALPSFEEFYESMQAAIIEGGRTVDELDPWIEQARQGGCIELAELALEIEYDAYDLYRNLAHREKNEDKEKVLLDLAQAEKDHARMIMSRLDSFLQPASQA